MCVCGGCLWSHSKKACRANRQTIMRGVSGEQTQLVINEVFYKLEVQCVYARVCVRSLDVCVCSSIMCECVLSSEPGQRGEYVCVRSPALPLPLKQPDSFSASEGLSGVASAQPVQL